MSKQKILLQLDTDEHYSVFDAVVAIDSGVDQLLSHHGVEPTEVESLVHGAIFTRGIADLASTAIFVGGSNVAAAERLLRQVQNSFVGPMRCSVMLDANGANTTAAAAVLAAADHLPLRDATAAVLGATGPVGQRVALLLALAGCRVRIGSRSLNRAEQISREVSARLQELGCETEPQLQPVETGNVPTWEQSVGGCDLIFTAGAAGVELLPEDVWRSITTLKVAIDLNAVPPLGVGGIDMMDRGKQRHGVICYGAIGVGGTKMKIHKAAIRQLFEKNDQVLDAPEIFQIGQSLAS